MKKAIDAAPYIDRKANCRNADPDTCIELYKTEIKKIDKKIRSGVPLDEFDPLLERRSLYVQMIHIKKNFFPTEYISYFGEKLWNKFISKPIQNFVARLTSFVKNIINCSDSAIEQLKKIIVDHFQDKLTGENKLLTSSEPILEAFTATIVKIPFTKIIFRIVDIKSANSIEERFNCIGKLVGTVIKFSIFPSKKLK